MQTLASKIKRLPQADKFAAVVAKHGFTIDSWAITTDKILKARRVATLGTGDAAALGYCDVYHFSRVFTAHVHCPPGKFRRAAR